jgi:hypothetical protein
LGNGRLPMHSKNIWHIIKGKETTKDSIISFHFRMKGWAKSKARSPKPSAWAGCLNSTTVMPYDFFDHTGTSKAGLVKALQAIELLPEPHQKRLVRYDALAMARASCFQLARPANSNTSRTFSFVSLLILLITELSGKTSGGRR